VDCKQRQPHPADTDGDALQKAGIIRQTGGLGKGCDRQNQRNRKEKACDLRIDHPAGLAPLEEASGKYETGDGHSKEYQNPTE
jgi:hypothetical protein